jgi:deazaflavin-dependent oxidoreductase (nitroreductase family)
VPFDRCADGASQPPSTGSVTPRQKQQLPPRLDSRLILNARARRDSKHPVDPSAIRRLGDNHWQRIGGRRKLGASSSPVAYNHRETIRKEQRVSDYQPSPVGWVREQVEQYEASDGTAGTTLRDTGLPVVIVTHTGHKTGALRKTPLMRVVTDDGTYVLVASKGGAPENPLWYYNLRRQSEVEIRDGERVFRARIHEVTDPAERARLWPIAVQAYPPYAEYQQRTTRQIPLFAAQPL